MKKYNIIVIFDKNYQNVLMCLRRKDPFSGLYNFVGGKINDDETSEQAAYRELYEETHINRKNLTLKHVHDMIYYFEDMILEVWTGKLDKFIEVYGDENDLEWISLSENFFDVQRFAGYGNIGHILYSIHLNKKEIL
ncbi:NUDIX hydrolase [Candidatus Stoquefichus massiliensis]|uniref:NUDIX hydrolase n=1 Tax=Candidatus Stoquefichus massiliensis TaxID=1470350 RepID=UPI000485BC20|nr:NUDIX hydrolase [Candidatus Stoquefichus massiliensis]